MIEMQKQIEDLVAYLREDGGEAAGTPGRRNRGRPSSGPPPVTSSRLICSSRKGDHGWRARR